jgi:serine/threonine protein kinase
MSFEHTSGEHPSLLQPGTQVGDWRVEDRRGQGAYGVVYRAVRVGQEDAGPVALKLAVYPWDQRFAREAELLSRLSHHPGVPRLLGRGLWRHAPGVEHPYLVMEWVEGTPLYDWARQHEPAGRQVLQLLAQLARVLEALHAAGGVHRDVKGDNVLVRHVDGRVVLIDFGSGHFQGATRLTWQSLPPCTLAYLSAEASLFYIRSVRDRDAYYPPTPADDVFALGVTAYRLVMGEYPPPMEPHQDDAGCWHVTSPDPRPLLEANSRVEPKLRELILRMLSAAPEARGTAAELARALEAAADDTGAESLATPRQASEDAEELAPARPEVTAGQASEVVEEAEPPRALVTAGREGSLEGPGSRSRARARRPWLVLAAAAVIGLLLWSSQPAPEPVSASREDHSGSRAPDADTSAVGDTSPTAPLASVKAPSGKKPLTQELPFQPRPGQARPDAKGRCPGRNQVVINSACWVEQRPIGAEECAENGYDFREGKCYAPVLAPRRQPPPTSSPSEAR